MGGAFTCPHTWEATSLTPAIPAPAQLDPNSAVSLQCQSVSEASPGESVSPSAPAPGRFFTLFSFSLLAALGLSCCLWDANLNSRPGNEAGPLHWEQRLSPWTTRARPPCPDLIKDPQRSLAVGLGHLPSLIRWFHHTSFRVKPLATLGSQLSGPSAVPASLCFLWHQSRYRAGLVAVVDLSPPICPLGDHGGGS